MKHLSEFKNVKMKGIVEHVLGRNRFALLGPNKRVMLRCPSDRLGQEAMAFCERRYLNREIEFSVQNADTSGDYVPNMAL
jgi:hypothetical protein